MITVGKSFLLIIGLISIILINFPILAQTTTVWGPGNGYKIAYLHSGKTILNTDILLEFENLPVAEFTIKNITNNGYKYTYRGFTNESVIGSITMIKVNYPTVGSIEFPSGGFPVALPLAFNGKSDWIVSFAETIKALSNIVSNEELSQFISADVEIYSNAVSFSTFSTLNETTLASASNTFLPLIGRDLINGTINSGNITANLTYRRSTGVLFSLDTEFSSNNYTDNMGKSVLANINIIQSLEFVAIIPPASILEEAIDWNNLWFISIILVTIIMKRKNFKLKRLD